ncbi:hypothetical protein Sa4125_37160 [Aureimonas sp. SA4125]|nr:hypothetical protein Sa4125_37160 [Aureimonas sp. SA4125]
MVGTPTPRPFPWIIGGIVIAALALLFGTFAAGTEQIRSFFTENGAIEYVQAICLAVTAVLFAATFLKSSGARALFCVGSFGAIVTATTREIPRCGSAFYDGGLCLTAGGKNTVVIACAVLCVLALLWRPLDWRKVLHPTALRWVWPSFVVMAILAGAEFAEHVVQIELEESLELAAYLYLAAFSLWFLHHTRQDLPPPEAVPAVPARRSPEQR